MPISKSERLRKAYESKLGKTLVSKLSDDQIKLISKYYNSLSDSEQSNIDSKILQGYDDTDLHEMARGFIEEEEDDEQIPEGLDDLLSGIRTPEPKVTKITSSALVAVGGSGKKVDGKKFLGNDKYQKYVDELTSSGTIDGEQLSPEERKEGFKKRNDKIGFETFVKNILKRKESATVGQGKKLSNVKSSAIVKSPTSKIDVSKLTNAEENENYDEILGKIDSILNTLRDEEKLKKKESEKDRKSKEKEKRGKKEKKLESTIFKGLAKGVDKVLQPVKSIFQKIFEFFTAIFFGRIITKIFDWLGDKKNQEKLDNFVRFLSDFWPVIAGAFLLFGTSFGRLIRTIGKWSVQIARFAIPKLLRFIKRNPRTALVLAGAGYLGARILSNKEAGAGEDQSEQPEQPEQPQETSGKEPVKMAQGGKVPGSGNRDTVPAMLTPGEFVMSKGAVAKYGVDTLSSMNAMGGGTNIPSLTGEGVLGYKEGGQVSGDPNEPAKAGHDDKGVGYTKQISSRQKARRGGRSKEKEGGESPPTSTPTPAPESASKPMDAKQTGSTSGVKVVSVSHPDTGGGYSVEGLSDQQGRPAVFSRGAAEAFGKMMTDSKGVVKGSDIASSQRSKSKNAAVGGVPNSNHLFGNALDIHGRSQTWMRTHGPKYGWMVHDYAGSHGGHFNYKGPGADQRGGGGALSLTGTAKNLIGKDKEFLKRVDEVSKKIGANPADLLGLMASESGLNPQSVNSSSGATGLIQFMPDTARELGTSTSALRGMSRVEQMDYVEKYLLKTAPKNPTPGHLYTSVFLPAFAKKPANYVVAKRGGFTDSWGNHPASWYTGNAGLDMNKDGSITIAELGERIKQKQKAFGIGGGSAIGGGTMIADSTGGGGGGGGGGGSTSEGQQTITYDPQTQSYKTSDGGTIESYDWDKARAALGVSAVQSPSAKTDSISKPSRPSVRTSTASVTSQTKSTNMGGSTGLSPSNGGLPGKTATNIPLVNSMAMTSTRKVKTLGIMI